MPFVSLLDCSSDLQTLASLLPLTMHRILRITVVPLSVCGGGRIYCEFLQISSVASESWSVVIGEGESKMILIDSFNR